MIFPEGTTTDGTALIRFEYFFPFFEFSICSILFKSNVLPKGWCLHPWETGPAGMIIFLLPFGPFQLFLKVGISYEGASHVIWTEGSSSLLWVGRYIPEEDVDYNDGEPGDCLHPGHPAHPHHRHLPPSDAALSKGQVVKSSFDIILLFWISFRLQLMSANGRVGSKTFAEEVTN